MSAADDTLSPAPDDFIPCCVIFRANGFPHECGLPIDHAGRHECRSDSCKQLSAANPETPVAENSLPVMGSQHIELLRKRLCVWHFQNEDETPSCYPEDRICILESCILAREILAVVRAQISEREESTDGIWVSRKEIEALKLSASESEGEPLDDCIAAFTRWLSTGTDHPRCVHGTTPISACEHCSRASVPHPQPTQEVR